MYFDKNFVFNKDNALKRYGKMGKTTSKAKQWNSFAYEMFFFRKIHLFSIRDFSANNLYVSHSFQKEMFGRNFEEIHEIENILSVFQSCVEPLSQLWRRKKKRILIFGPLHWMVAQTLYITNEWVNFFYLRCPLSDAHKLERFFESRKTLLNSTKWWKEWLA